jgi:nitrogen fixation NifU-like protein
VNAPLHPLYRDVIVAHAKRPHNFRPLGAGSMHAEESNPLCGDTVTVFADVTDDVLRDVTFQGAACAVSTASASMMTEAARGRTIAVVSELFEAVQSLLVGAGTSGATEKLSDLTALACVRDFPSRVRCALLPWRALQTALRRRD